MLCIAPKRFLLWIVVCFSMQATQAQDLSQLKFDVYDEENRLSNNWITDIAKDSIGFIWVGTKNGLNRYDGNSFKVFKHKEGDKTSLLNDNGQNIAVDLQGNVMVSHHNGGMSKYDAQCQCFAHVNSAPTK